VKHARTRRRAISLVAVVIAAGCREGHQVRWDQLPPGTVVVAVDSVTAARNATRQPGALTTVVADTVVGWTGPGKRPFEVARRTAAPDAGHARRFGTITLPIVLRVGVPALTQFPCTSCHAGSRVVMAARRTPDAHHDIQPVHPDSSGDVCATCHARDDVASLVLIDGGRATLNQSYRLCAQCHFAQVDAWAAGGHGKRLDGWQGRRVVMACTDCHDPHRPAVQERIPFRAPELEKARSPIP
jgi:hypothetical protein